MRGRNTTVAALAILGVWLGAGPADAGALAFTASVDRTTVAINQPLTLTITLSGELPRLDAPPDFDMPQPFVVAARSQSTNVSIGGGHGGALGEFRLCARLAPGGDLSVGAVSP